VQGTFVPLVAKKSESEKAILQINFPEGCKQWSSISQFTSNNGSIRITLLLKSSQLKEK